MSSNSVKRLFMRYCKGRSSLFRLAINFVIVAICGLFLVTQLYKHSSVSQNSVDSSAASFEKLEGKTENFERRPVVLPVQSIEDFQYVEPSNSFFKQKHNVLRTKVDWHNYTAIEADKKRRGPGEQGKKFVLTDPDDIKRNNALLRVNGYYAVASDIISPNRSVGDIRHPLCQKKKYFKELPTTSIVIPFFNDHLSVLMRSVHSVFNRAPAHLLKEVILVNDRSDKDELYGELESYLAKNFDGKAHVIHLPERGGLITARIVGAMAATGDVLVFLDSHIEASINYLPPLLDPIAEDYRTCVCPFIDVIDAQNYQYRAQDEGQRGGFEWNFLYKRMEIRPGDQETPADNFPSPVMAGGLFAISTKFFWELGGYDPGLDIWGGEQYELSFKIWLCGGTMVDSPCSRIGHIYKSNPFPAARQGKDYLSVNFKRVAEVWMDEYKEYLYARKPNRYKNVETGDISKQLEVKERLKCKSFKYFLEEVAPDLLKNYPPFETEFAKGSIENVAFPNKCIDSGGQFYHNMVLYYCSPNKKYPSGHQHYSLGQYKEIIFYSDAAYCIEPVGDSIQLHACHHTHGNQYFRYDLDTQQLKHKTDEKKCLQASDDGSNIVLRKCDDNEKKQKWKWGQVEEENLRNWENAGAKID